MYMHRGPRFHGLSFRRLCNFCIFVSKLSRRPSWKKYVRLSPFLARTRLPIPTALLSLKESSSDPHGHGSSSDHTGSTTPLRAQFQWRGLSQLFSFSEPQIDHTSYSLDTSCIFTFDRSTNRFKACMRGGASDSLESNSMMYPSWSFASLFV